MKRNTFIRSLIGLPFIGGALLETVKQKPVEVKKTMGYNILGIPSELASIKPIDGTLCRVDGAVWCALGGSWRLMATRAWVDTKENCEQKINFI